MASLLQKSTVLASAFTQPSGSSTRARMIAISPCSSSAGACPLGSSRLNRASMRLPASKYHIVRQHRSPWPSTTTNHVRVSDVRTQFFWGSTAAPESDSITTSEASASSPDGAAGDNENDEKTMTLLNVISSLARASSAWELYDTNRDGVLSLEETEALINSAEISQAIELLTNTSCTYYTAADLDPYFRRADTDNSGTLTRTEFLALYLAVATERVKKNPLLLAEALLGFIDTDKNGVLEGGEIKVLLTILGFPAILLLPIPDFIKLEYKAILRGIGSMLEKRP